MKERVSSRHTWDFDVSPADRSGRKRKAYELGLVDHGCKNHPWTTYALIESSPGQFLPFGRARVWRVHVLLLRTCFALRSHACKLAGGAKSQVFESSYARGA